MKITVHSSKVVKPDYGGGAAHAVAVPLSVFDKIADDHHFSSILFFHAPAPAADALEAGFARALAVYREWAGRLGTGGDGGRAILLDDAGARLAEATADVALGGLAQLLNPPPELPSLCPSPSEAGGGGEVLLAQVTRFACGAFALGTTYHHVVGDAYGLSRFLAAWGKATRGAAVDPVPLFDRVSLFAPPDPSVAVAVEHRHRHRHRHRGVEFVPRDQATAGYNGAGHASDLVTRMVRFTPEMVAALRSLASSGGAPRPYRYSALQSVAAHLWRCITRARGLGGDQATTLEMSVNGRPRMRHPPVPPEYCGNVLLLARASAAAGDLLAAPLPRAAELVSEAVARVDGGYFRSFVDFASSGAVEAEGLVPVTCTVPTVFVSNLKGIPTHDLDFGSGLPFYFTRTNRWEGCAFIMPPFSADPNMHVQVTLRRDAMEIFKACCYSLPPANARL